MLRIPFLSISKTYFKKMISNIILCCLDLDSNPVPSVLRFFSMNYTFIEKRSMRKKNATKQKQIFRFPILNQKKKYVIFFLITILLLCDIFTNYYSNNYEKICDIIM